MNLSELEIYQKLYKSITNYLTHKMRTVFEARNKLASYYRFYTHVSPDSWVEIINKLIEDLKDQRFLDDTNYVSYFLETSLNSTKPKSTQKIKGFLLRKGIPLELLEENLANISLDTERSNLLLLAEKRLKRLETLENTLKRQKLTEFLLRKGFSYALVESVVDTLAPLK